MRHDTPFAPLEPSPEHRSPALSSNTNNPPSVENWTTRALLEWMRGAFTEKGIDSPRLSAEMLLCHVIGCERMHLYTQTDRPSTPEERLTLRELVTRALRHEPIQYLVGEGWFFSYPFHVDRRVLIPRPSTETLLEHALQSLRTRTADAPVRLADIGTGSGCIAIAALKMLPDASGVAVDLSSDALDVARLNAERHGVLERLELVEGDLLGPLAGRAPFDLILSNPPYIPDHEWGDVEPNVKDHEPTGALRAGPTGLELVRPVIEGAPALLAQGGRVYVEIAACTADEALRMARSQPMLDGAEVLKDLDGLPRVVTALRV